MKPLFLFLLAALSLGIGACRAAAPEPTPPPAATSAITPTFRRWPATWTPAPPTPALPSPTPRPSATATLSPVPSPSPTASASPTPAPTLIPPTLAAPFDTLRLAFVAGDTLYLWQSGSLRAVFRAPEISRPSFSPDGRFIAFGYQQELWVVDALGGDPRPLVSAADFAALEPVAIGVSLYQWDWLPGASQILFNTALRYDAALVLTDDLHRVDAASGERVTLAQPNTGGLFFPAPQGDWIAYVSARRISVMRSDGSNRQTLLEYPPVQTYSDYEFYPRVFWRLDGSALASLIPPPDPQADPAALATIWELPLDGAAPRSLAQLALGYPPMAVYFSPDLTRMARVQPNLDNPQAADLYLSGLDLSAETLYYSGNVTFDRWSPDGRYFTFWLDGNLNLGAAGEGLASLGGAGSLRWISPQAFVVQLAGAGGVTLALGQPLGEQIPLAGPFAEWIDWDFIP